MSCFFDLTAFSHSHLIPGLHLLILRFLNYKNTLYSRPLRSVIPYLHPGLFRLLLQKKAAWQTVFSDESHVRCRSSLQQTAFHLVKMQPLSGLHYNPPAPAQILEQFHPALYTHTALHRSFPYPDFLPR